MHQSLSPEAFDFSSLDAETLQFVQQRERRIKLLMRRTARDIIEIGQQLIEIKEKLGHGRFENWLKAEFDWTQMTANRFMNVSRKFESNNLLDLSIAPSALYLLAAPSTPNAAREEAIARAEAGEQITYKVAQEIVKQKKQRLSPSDNQSNLTKAKPIIFKPEPQSALRLTPDGVNQSHLKPEILALLPKQRKQPDSEAQTPFVEQQVQPGSWWQLGSKHLLYCGQPHSAQFQAQLRGPIALSMTFPRRRDHWSSSPNPNTKSALSLFTVYQDQDLDLLRLLVKSALELYTEGHETVVFSFLSDPELLLTAHQLGCSCFVAEPEAALCEAIVAAWRQTGAKARKVNCLKF